MKKYIILLLAIAALSSRASAYTLIVSSTGQVPTWTSMPVQFWINQNGSPQIANGSEFEAVKAAFQTWQNVSIASVSLQYMGTTPVPTVGEDGMNVVTFVDDSVPLGLETIASTFSFFNIDGTGTLTIKEADIALSTSIDFSTSGEPNKYDIQSVVTHEAGHLLGLDHSALLSSVMTPYGAAGQLDQRTLSYDDMAGLAFLYANSSAILSLGAVSGTITASGNGVFGAHVVALDTNGSPVASTISNPDGTYEIDFLPPGAYRLYAEPLDGPVTEQNIGGASTSFYSGLNTAFSTTYTGDVPGLAQATSRQVFANLTRPTSNVNIHVSVAGGLNLTEPATYAPHISLGSSSTLTVGGTTLGSGDSFSVSGSGITLGTPTYGGSVASDAPTSAVIPITVATTAITGPKNLAVTVNAVTSVLSGAVVITNPQPGNIFVAPTNGSVDGGTAVSITGQNFRSGAQVYLGGLAASSVQVVNGTTIQAIVPANSAGSANAVVVNSDGTWGVQAGAFTYTAMPPQVTSAAPLNGPPTTVVTILGSEFSSRISDINVQFNGTSANIVSASRTQIQALVPYGAVSGPITVSVLGQSATGPAFTVSASAVSTNLASAAAQFVDATSGGSPLAFEDSDDSTALVSLPFTFTLFNKSYASGTPLAVCTNGWISLDAWTTPEYQNGPLPGAGTNPPALVAPFFDDLVLKAASAVTVLTSGTTPNRELVIEWSNAGILDDQGNDTGAAVTFEAILYEGSNDIQFIYKSPSGTRSDGSSATIGIQDSARLQAVQSGYNQSIVTNGLVLTYHFLNGAYGPAASTAPPPPATRSFSITDRGGVSVITDGSGATATVGYATIQPSPGNTTPGGVAIFGFTQNRILVTEAGVPASPLLLGGRLYAQVGGGIDTGVAIANPNNQTAMISFSFTDSTGRNFGAGTGTIPPNGQIAEYLDQSMPLPFNSGNVQGAFTFTSNVPVGVIALRDRTNERGETLYTTLPVLDTSAPASTSTQILSRFADGLGWTTQVILVNPGNSVISGTINFYGGLDQPLLDGKPVTLTAGAGGQSLSTFPYSIPAQSSFSLQTAGIGAITQTGSVQVVPASGSAAPSSLSIFSLQSAGVTVTEAGVASVAGTAFRMYVEASGTPYTLGSIQTGLAIANSSPSPATVTLDLTSLSGAELGLTTSITIPGNGEIGEFLSQLYVNQTLPLPLKGILRITSSGPGLSVVGLRGRYNQRNEFLITTTPASNEASTATSAEMVFPQVANGGGYTTQFILFSGTTGQSTSGSMNFVNQNGTPLGLNLN